MSVRNAILGLLAQRPRHGYELRSAFEALMGGEQNWEVKPAQIYTTLARLEESGLVMQAVEGESSEAGEGISMHNEKRIYAITPAGKDELARWFTEAVEAEHQRDEFYLKLMLCLATEIQQPDEVIHVQRSRLYRDLHQVTTRRATLSAQRELAQIMLLDKTVMHLEADLRWLDMIESRLDEIRKHPPPEPELRPRGRPKKK